MPLTLEIPSPWTTIDSLGSFLRSVARGVPTGGDDRVGRWYLRAQEVGLIADGQLTARGWQFALTRRQRKVLETWPQSGLRKLDTEFASAEAKAFAALGVAERQDWNTYRLTSMGRVLFARLSWEAMERGGGSVYA